MSSSFPANEHQSGRRDLLRPLTLLGSLVGGNDVSTEEITTLAMGSFVSGERLLCHSAHRK
jgi:hypothetical protein